MSTQNDGAKCQSDKKDGPELSTSEQVNSFKVSIANNSLETLLIILDN